MSYAILDNNRFYAEGLRYALLRRGVQPEVISDTVQWQPTLLSRRVIVARCRFSVAATHHALVDILLRLEASRWRGTVYLVCNEKGWALATHLRKRFATLTLYILDDRIAVAEATCLLAKAPRRVRSLCCCLTGIEFTILDMLINGLPVRHITHIMQMSEKQVSNYKCNALKKLNANNLLQLLL